MEIVLEGARDRVKFLRKMMRMKQTIYAVSAFAREWDIDEGMAHAILTGRRRVTESGSDLIVR